MANIKGLALNGDVSIMGGEDNLKKYYELLGEKAKPGIIIENETGLEKLYYFNAWDRDWHIKSMVPAEGELWKPTFTMNLDIVGKEQYIKSVPFLIVRSDSKSNGMYPGYYKGNGVYEFQCWLYPGQVHLSIRWDDYETDISTFNVSESPEGYASFAEATDAQIAKMISDHYNGICNISDFWHIGDTRTIHMNATSAKSYKEQAYEDQDLTIEIIGFNHDDLVNPINGKTKAAITVDCKNSIAGTYERYWGKSYTTVQDTDTWDNNPMRQWFNEDFIAALPENISSSIKTVKKKNMKLHSSTDGAPIITQDKAFLLSESELVSASEYSSAYKGNTDAEGEQYEFYKTESNRIKNADKYWLRSPALGSRNAYNWCGVFNDGKCYDYAGGANSGLAPAFCL